MTKPISEWEHRNELYRKAFEEEREAEAVLVKAREAYLIAHRRRSLILRNVLKSEARDFETS